MGPAPISPPEADEHASFYTRYVERARGIADLRGELSRQPAALRHALAGVPDARLGPYAPGKWSVRQVVGHLIDLERVFSYRVLRFSRGDGTPLPGFDQDAYVQAGRFDERSLASLLDELDLVRSGTLALLDGITADGLLRRGTSNGVPVSVRALLYVIAGHTTHHLDGLAANYGLEPA